MPRPTNQRGKPNQEDMETKTQETAVVKAAPPGSILAMLQGDQFKHAIKKVIHKSMSEDRFARVAYLCAMRTPDLQKCDKVSLYNSLLTLSQLGLEPDDRRAHLLPFNNNKRGCMEVQLIIDYKGLVELVMRSGRISKIHADIVCDNDDFVYDKGEIQRHKIDFKNPRGKIYAVYAICTTKDGYEKAEVMSVEDVEAIRSRSRSKDKGPWVTDWEEMAKKTVFRRLSKWLPWLPEERDAIESDDDQYEEPKTYVSSAVTDLGSIEVTPQKALDQGDGTDLGPVTQKTEAKKEDKSDLAPHAKLAAILTKEGISVDTFMQWAQDAGQYVGPTPGGIDDLDSKWLTTWLKSERAFGRQVEIMKGGAK